MTTSIRYQVLSEAATTITAHLDPELSVAVQDLAALLPRFTEACRRLQDSRPTALGAASYDGPSVTSTGTSDPTGRLALTPDHHARDRKQLDRLVVDLSRLAKHAPQHVKRVSSDAYQLRRLVEAWTPRAPSDRDRRQVEHANDKGLCEHHRTVGLVEYTEHTGTVSGNLNLPMALCGPCYWQVRRTGKLPSGEWMERRARLGKDEGVRA
jgi:hypothetical protein